MICGGYLKELLKGTLFKNYREGRKEIHFQGFGRERKNGKIFLENIYINKKMIFG